MTASHAESTTPLGNRSAPRSFMNEMSLATKVLPLEALVYLHGALLRVAQIGNTLAPGALAVSPIEDDSFRYVYATPTKVKMTEVTASSSGDDGKLTFTTTGVSTSPRSGPVSDIAGALYDYSCRWLGMQRMNLQAARDRRILNRAGIG